MFGGSMNKNKLALGLSMVFGIILLVGFQNCGKIQPGLDVQEPGLVQQENTRAIVQDGNGNVDAIISTDEPNIDPGVSSDPVVVNEPVVTNDPVIVDDPQIPAVDPIIENIPADASCIELAKKYKKHAIDIANFDQQGKLTVLKGKTFIYSSNGNISLKDVDIGLSCGRTILCGVHIGKIRVKKGRLDLIRSSYTSIDESHGRIDVK